MEQRAPPTSSIISEAEYLRLETASESKHEFRHGQLIDMAGGTLQHAQIARNLICYLSKSTGRKAMPSPRQ
jgi:hypothetical protein